MSGTTMSTPSSSDSGNMRPASMTMMSSPQRTAMQFMPNSPSPPRGTTCSLPAGINFQTDASTRYSVASRQTAYELRTDEHSGGAITTRLGNASRPRRWSAVQVTLVPLGTGEITRDLGYFGL